MFKKLILAFALSMFAGSAFAACTNPLVIKDGSAANISMSTTSNADGFCQYNFNMAQINGVVPLMGNGATGTGSPRVTLSNDNTIPTGWPTAANQTTMITALSGPSTLLAATTCETNSYTNGATSSFNSNLKGAGCVEAARWGGAILGAASNFGTSPGTVIVPGANSYNWVFDQVGGSPAAMVGDPCQTTAKTTLPITLATAAVKVIAVGVSAKKIYVCQINLNNNAANTVAVFEATTATTCATSPVAVVGAGTSVATAGTGYNFGATGGISLGNGATQVLQTSVNANDLCIAQSAATQLSGSITYVTR